MSAEGRRRDWRRVFAGGLETKRLVLRGLTETDFKRWRKGYAERQPKQHAFDRGPVAPSGLTRERFDHYRSIHWRDARRDKAYVFCAFLRESGAAAGFVDISILERPQNSWANIGYVIHNQFQRQGLGKEAVAGVLKISAGILRLNRIEAAIRPDNTPAIALAKACGMRREGIRKRFWLDDDGWQDHVIYAAIAAD